jgi:hypothetical protein
MLNSQSSKNGNYFLHKTGAIPVKRNNFLSRILTYADILYYANTIFNFVIADKIVSALIVPTWK